MTATKNRAPIDDLTLARWLAAADPRAPLALWRKYAALVRGILRRRIGPGADVDDLVQDTFIGLLRNLPALRDPNALRSFVVATAIRFARSEHRRRRGGSRRLVTLTRTGTMPDAAREGAPDPETRRVVTRIFEVLDDVDDRGRMAFVLRHVQGYELTEVARSLGCSLATAKRSLAKVQGFVSAMAQRDPLLAVYARGCQRNVAT
jgi:RNA polymerase sigma-70 factor (ECF subfamily)